MHPPAMLDGDRKRADTCAAELALLGGHVLHTLADECGAPLFIVTCGPFSRTFDGPGALDDLDAFVRRIARAPEGIV